MSLVFIILLNILLFSAATFGTSLLIEKYYHGRLKWILVPFCTFLSAFIMIKTGLVLKVLYAITTDFTIQDFGLILLGGIVTGIFFSFL
jgi:hypothetical protein